MRYSRVHHSKRAWVLLLGVAAMVLLAFSVVGCEVPGVVGDGGTLTTGDSHSHYATRRDLHHHSRSTAWHDHHHGVCRTP